MRSFIIIFVAAGLIACSKDKNEDPSFQEFLKEVPTHQPTISFHCGLDKSIRSDGLKKFQKFLPKRLDRIFGLIGKVENHALIIFGYTGDDIYPYLFSYNDQGTKIDSIALILNPCGGADESHIPNSYCVINKNFEITLSDTTRFIHFPGEPNGLDVHVLDSVRISSKSITLDGNGHFISQGLH